jgi:hypothetical protein
MESGFIKSLVTHKEAPCAVNLTSSYKVSGTTDLLSSRRSDTRHSGGAPPGVANRPSPSAEGFGHAGGRKSHLRFPALRSRSRNNQAH